MDVSPVMGSFTVIIYINNMDKISILDFISNIPIQQKQEWLLFLEKNPDQIPVIEARLNSKINALKRGDGAGIRKIIFEEKQVIQKILDAIKIEEIKQQL